MIDEITFGQIHLLWPIVIGSIFLWLLFIWKEWDGRPGLRFYIKIIVALIAVSSLAMIALQPNVRGLEKISYTAVLSDGYQKADLDSLKKVYKRIKVIDYKPGKDLSTEIEKGQEVFILGQGLQAFDLWQLDDVKAYLLEGEDPAGISQLKYEQESVVGNDFNVKGNYHRAIKGRQLVLNGPGDIPLDSLQLLMDTDQKFSLKARHIVEGKFVYSLVEKDSLGNQISSAPLAVKVSPRNTLNVLVVNEFPSFETKYLKNFLAEAGHQVVVRSQVSKDRYKYEYFNTPQKGVISLSSKTLSEVDLLIIDMASLQKFSKSTLQRLGTAISEQGLGIFIQTDETSYTSRIPLFDFNFAKQETKEVSFENDPKEKLTKYPYQFKNEVLLEAVHTSDQGIVTAYKRSGAGRVGTTVLQNTYELVLEGRTDLYQRLWSKTIRIISKRQGLETVWQSDDLMVYKDQPFHFQIKTTIKSPVVKSKDGYRLPLARGIDLTQVWSGITFPRQLGWNEILVEHDSTEVLDFYVIDSTQWTSLGLNKTKLVNNRYVEQQKNNSVKSTSLRPIRLWWFFILFLAAMTFLWLEPKM